MERLGPGGLPPLSHDEVMRAFRRSVSTEYRRQQVVTPVRQQDLIESVIELRRKTTEWETLHGDQAPEPYEAGARFGILLSSEYGRFGLARHHAEAQVAELLTDPDIATFGYPANWNFPMVLKSSRGPRALDNAHSLFRGVAGRMFSQREPALTNLIYPEPIVRGSKIAGHLSNLGVMDILDAFRAAAQ